MYTLVQTSCYFNWNCYVRGRMVHITHLGLLPDNFFTVLHVLSLWMTHVRVSPWLTGDDVLHFSFVWNKPKSCVVSCSRSFAWADRGKSTTYRNLQFNISATQMQSEEEQRKVLFGDCLTHFSSNTLRFEKYSLFLFTIDSALLNILYAFVRLPCNDFCQSENWVTF